MDVISESLRLSQRTHLFNWLQGEFQFLLGHEVMICGVKSTDSDAYQYEYFTSTRYFTDIQFNSLVEQQTGLVDQVIKQWKESAMPLFVVNATKPSEFSNYSIVNYDELALQNSELKDFVVHGFGDQHSKISSVVIFARLHKPPGSNNAHMLELIMPHLHCALIRITSSRNNVVMTSSQTSNIMTKRELEILQWLHMGKTNWEISTILDISPLTVKNHVQNVLRKLDVQNRSQAAVKAAKLGLIKILK